MWFLIVKVLQVQLTILEEISKNWPEYELRKFTCAWGKKWKLAFTWHTWQNCKRSGWSYQVRSEHVKTPPVSDVGWHAVHFESNFQKITNRTTYERHIYEFALLPCTCVFVYCLLLQRWWPQEWSSGNACINSAILWLRFHPFSLTTCSHFTIHFSSALGKFSNIVPAVPRLASAFTTTLSQYISN